LASPCAGDSNQVIVRSTTPALISVAMMHSNADITFGSVLGNEVLTRSIDSNSIQRRGLLPFKKRRLILESTPSWERTPLSNEYYTSSETVTPSPAYSDSYNRQSTDRIAALAIVAAATARFPLTLSTISGPQGETETDQRNSRLHNVNSEISTGSIVHFPLAFGPPPVTPTGLVTPRELPDSNPRRIHHLPLAAPLPGGCHGRTSRNNSFCRRQPCYNGSKYCKLHYQQYISPGARVQTIGTDGCLSEGTVQSESSIQAPISARQDKRYTGCDDDVRCLATTTRGRPCAYVSVTSSKYCFLHADYDANPPPRRGGSGSTPKTSKIGSTAQNEIEGCPPIPDLLHVTESPLYQADTPRRAGDESQLLALEDACSVASSRSEMENAKLPPQLIKCSYPLLGSISSDQWFDKYVLIGLGPFVNRVGKIVKWGNGWVSVNVQSESSELPDMLLHNRRSVELFLLPPEQQTIHTEKERDHLVLEDSIDSHLLKRCVSREVGEPTDLDTHGGLHEFRQDSGDDTNPRIYSINSDDHKTHSVELFTAPAVETEGGKYFPGAVNSETEGRHLMEEETRDVVCLDEISKVVNLAIDHQSVARTPEGSDTRKNVGQNERNSNNIEKNYQNLHSVEGALQVHTVAPLSECLFQAQHGLISKSKLGLLFGTAALERGRRKVQKPTRYEDIALNNRSPRSPRKSKA